MRGFAQGILETMRHPLLTLNGDLRVYKAKAAFYHRFKTAEAETEGRHVFEPGGGECDIQQLQMCWLVLNEAPKLGGGRP